MTPELVLELAGAVAGATGTGAGGVLLERVHRRRRYARTLANIDRLERELDIAQPPPAFQPRDFISHASAAAAHAQNYTRPSAPRPRPQTGPVGYQGPELTDADVRRLEHPNEFPS